MREIRAICLGNEAATRKLQFAGTSDSQKMITKNVTEVKGKFGYIR